MVRNLSVKLGFPSRFPWKTDLNPTTHLCPGSEGQSESQERPPPDSSLSTLHPTLRPAAAPPNPGDNQTCPQIAREQPGCQSVWRCLQGEQSQAWSRHLHPPGRGRLSLPEPQARAAFSSPASRRPLKHGEGRTSTVPSRMLRMNWTMSSVLSTCLSSRKYCWFEVFRTTTVGTFTSLKTENKETKIHIKHTDNKHSDIYILYNYNYKKRQLY